MSLPEFSIPRFPEIPKPPVIVTAELISPHAASEYHKKLFSYITDFEKNLKDDEEVALKLVTFGETVVIVVESIGYFNPGLISFYGTDKEKNRVQLIQNVNQISFLLMAVKTKKPKEERRRIGFKPKITDLIIYSQYIIFYLFNKILEVNFFHLVSQPVYFSFSDG